MSWRIIFDTTNGRTPPCLSPRTRDPIHCGSSSWKYDYICSYVCLYKSNEYVYSLISIYVHGHTSYARCTAPAYALIFRERVTVLLDWPTSFSSFFCSRFYHSSFLLFKFHSFVIKYLCLACLLMPRNLRVNFEIEALRLWNAHAPY